MFDAVDGFFEIADFVGETVFFVVDDIVCLFDDCKYSGFSSSKELRLDFPAVSSLISILKDHEDIMCLVRAAQSCYPLAF